MKDKKKQENTRARAALLHCFLKGSKALFALSMLSAALLDRFFERYRALGSEECFEAYRRRCLVLGRRVTVLSGGVAVGEGEVLDLEQDYSLRIRYADGTEGLLNSGEVSVLP